IGRQCGHGRTVRDGQGGVVAGDSSEYAGDVVGPGGLAVGDFQGGRGEVSFGVGGDVRPDNLRTPGTGGAGHDGDAPCRRHREPGAGCVDGAGGGVAGVGNGRLVRGEYRAAPGGDGDGGVVTGLVSAGRDDVVVAGGLLFRDDQRRSRERAFAVGGGVGGGYLGAAGTGRTGVEGERDGRVGCPVGAGDVDGAVGFRGSGVDAGLVRADRPSGGAVGDVDGCVVAGGRADGRHDVIRTSGLVLRDDERDIRERALGVHGDRRRHDLGPTRTRRSRIESDGTGAAGGPAGAVHGDGAVGFGAGGVDNILIGDRRGGAGPAGDGDGGVVGADGTAGSGQVVVTGGFLLTDDDRGTGEFAVGVGGERPCRHGVTAGAGRAGTQRQLSARAGGPAGTRDGDS